VGEEAPGDGGGQDRVGVEYRLRKGTSRVSTPRFGAKLKTHLIRALHLCISPSIGRSVLTGPYVGFKAHSKTAHDLVSLSLCMSRVLLFLLYSSLSSSAEERETSTSTTLFSPSPTPAYPTAPLLLTPPQGERSPRPVPSAPPQSILLARRGDQIGEEEEEEEERQCRHRWGVCPRRGPRRWMSPWRGPWSGCAAPTAPGGPASSSRRKTSPKAAPRRRAAPPHPSCSSAAAPTDQPTCMLLLPWRILSSSVPPPPLLCQSANLLPTVLNS
jgi:hypothetical protein